MRVSELLNAVASWLENSDNEAVLLAEHDDGCLEATAEVCLNAARVLRAGAERVDALEPVQATEAVSHESLDSLAELAAALDSSEDPALRSTASVIDELLITVAASAEEVAKLRDAQSKKIDLIKQNYGQPRLDIAESDKHASTGKAIEKSEIGGKKYISMESPMSTRTCPDHFGTPVSRVGEDTYACPLDNKVYDFKTGFTNMKGDEIPGGNVANQTQLQLNETGNAVFDDREGRLQRS